MIPEDEKTILVIWRFFFFFLECIFSGIIYIKSGLKKEQQLKTA